MTHAERAARRALIKAKAEETRAARAEAPDAGLPQPVDKLSNTPGGPWQRTYSPGGPRGPESIELALDVQEAAELVAREEMR